MIRLVFFALVLIALMLLESHREKNKLSIEKYLFTSNKVKKDYKIVFLSDLHNKEFGENNKQLIQTIKDINPDLILIGGDLIVTKGNKVELNVLDNLLKELKDIGKVVYARGNHELRFYREEYKDKYGIYKDVFEEILKNNNVIYLNDNKLMLDDLCIYGLDIESRFYKDFSCIKMEDDYLVKHLGNNDSSCYNILLAHSPLYFDMYEKWGADLALCGHFHGGVLRIGKQGVLTSQWQLFHKWCCGYFKLNNSNMVVSRGLGGHTINVRLNNIPEVSVITIENPSLDFSTMNL